MQPVIGTAVQDRHAQRWLAALAPRLYAGEVVTALSTLTSRRPPGDAMAVTNARLLGFRRADLATAGLTWELHADWIGRADLLPARHGRFGRPALAVTLRSGRELVLGVVPRTDQRMVLDVVCRLAVTGAASGVRAAGHRRRPE